MPNHPQDNTLLRQVLAAPKKLATLRLAEWDQLLQAARAASLLARVEVLVAETNLAGAVPAPVGPHLIAARTVAENEARSLRWEMDRLAWALDEVACPVVLLKGAAYAVLNLPLAKGRISSDVDVLVPKEQIGVVEQRLLARGWAHVKLNDYDQYYYRHWSHELPPLQHRDRGTVVDVHHTILPPTGRLHPDPEKLLAASLPLPGMKFRVLAPCDMVLHCVVHAFQDGDLKRGLRDLVDIDGLLRALTGSEGFWRELEDRAVELGLTRPLFYALRYVNRYLATPLDPGLKQRWQSWQPPAPALYAMDQAVDRIITTGPWCDGGAVKLARQLLYIRSHWLRMPPYLLIPHLYRKALRARAGQAKPAER